MIALLLCLTGCEGVSGPRGDTGDIGEPGQSWQEQPPENRYFSLAVCNGSILSHNGAPKLYLAFDGEHSNAGDTIVCVQLVDGQVPSIDGIDEGDLGWGDKPTTVALKKVAGSDNFVTNATVRSAYGESYIYFQVQWTEVTAEESGFLAAQSARPDRWLVQADLGELPAGYQRARAWEIDPGVEDFLLLMFEVSTVDWFEHDGCYVTCHAGDGETNFHHTNQVRQRMDTWTWSAGLTQPTGFAADRYFDADTDPILSMSWDQGTPIYRINEFLADFDSAGARVDIPQPIYQHLSDPNYSAPFPFWDYELTTHDNNLAWLSGSAVPGYFSSIPFGSTADVAAFGLFDESTNTWTVEFKRARRTGNGDDAQF
jgi:hypothetical protein